MQQVVRFITQQGIDCIWNVMRVDNESEKIAERLVEYAKSKDGDLIIIMTKQELDIREFFIGSTATAIIEKSEIPVMSINPSFKYNYQVVI
jgi:nucleotide-binding universal stress UspA family protein